MDKPMSNWKKVVLRLWTAKKNNELFYLSRKPDAVISGGWLPMWAFRGAAIGGDCADRRLREARERGVPIIMKIHCWTGLEVVGGVTKEVKKRTPIYKLDCELSKSNWEKYLQVYNDMAHRQPRKE